MLELIRKYSNTKAAKVFLGVLTVTFLFCFRITEIIKKYTGKDYLVKIGDLKITPEAFKHEKKKQLDFLRNRLTQVEKVGKIDEKTEAIRILYQLIRENIIDLSAADFGFIVSNDVVKKYIISMPLFRDNEGRFRPDFFKMFISKAGISEQAFFEMLRRDIKTELMKLPFKYVFAHHGLEFYARAILEKRTLSIVEINPENIVISDKIPETELKEFHAKNPDSFIVPEMRSFRVFKLKEKDIEKSIAIPEVEMRDFYEVSDAKESKTFDEMKSEIESELRQEKLQSNVDDKIRQIEDAITSGENIDEVAKRFNLTAAKFRDIQKGAAAPLKMQNKKDVLTIAFSTEAGTASSFSETINEKKERVFWFVHVDSVIPKHASAFSEVSEKVKKEFQIHKRQTKARKLAESMVKQVSAKRDLSKVASQKGYLSKITAAFDRSGATVNAKNTKQQRQYSAIISRLHREAFHIPKGKAFFKEIDGSIVVYQVQNIIPATALDKQSNAKLAASLAKELSNDLHQQLIVYISDKKHKVEINHEMLEENNKGPI